MIVERVYDIAEVLKCVPYEIEVRRKGRDDVKLSKSLNFIRDSLKHPEFGVWMAYEDDDREEVLGYGVMVLSLISGFKRAHLFRLYARESGARDELIRQMGEWAKEHKVKDVQVTVRKNIKALCRRFGFRPVSVNLERRI